MRKPASRRPRPHWLKRAIRRAGLYPLAYAAYQLYRVLRQPHTHGALVAIWWEQRLLLVQSSYRRSLSLPGGGLSQGETPLQAARRELEEELGLRVAEGELVDPWQVTEQSAVGRNTVTIFAMHPEQQPQLWIDNLEISAAHWLLRDEALARPITSHLRLYLTRSDTKEERDPPKPQSDYGH